MRGTSATVHEAPIPFQLLSNLLSFFIVCAGLVAVDALNASGGEVYEDEVTTPMGTNSEVRVRLRQSSSDFMQCLPSSFVSIP